MDKDELVELFQILICLILGAYVITSDFFYLFLDNLYSLIYRRQ